MAGRIDFDGQFLPSEACRGQGAPAIRGQSELAGLTREQLIDHIVQLQNCYAQLENDHHFQAWEVGEFERNLNFFSRITELASRMNTTDIETIANISLNEIPAFFDCRQAALYLFDEDSATLSLYAASDSFPRQSPLNRAEQGEHFLFNLFFNRPDPYLMEYQPDVETMIIDAQSLKIEGIPPEWLEIFARRVIVLPLAIKRPGENKSTPLFLGGLILGMPAISLELSAVDLSTLFCSLISSSLHNAMLLRKLNEMTITDPLTRLFNRRHMMNQLSSAITHAQRQRHRLVLAMIDVDHFKRVNDTYRHLCGDKVLRQIADQLRRSTRSDIDVISRYGGEEFMIIMPYIGLNQALLVAERIRKNIEDHRIAWSNVRLSVTCSLGLAEYFNGESMDKLIDRADKALYDAKLSGRNRVVASPPPRQPPPQGEN
ncbi:MAG: GGDEF domain-containing protein [Planctomycetota bacterium]|jgi:two-component system cell cycle response regulator|nr:GGDEF domain-containing protein [Planctomycetota bacterium]